MSLTDSLHKILVHHDDSACADGLVRMACDLVGYGGRVVALAVTCVPPSLPLYGLSPDLDIEARDALRRARDVAEADGYGIETRLRHGRDIADVVLREAEDVQADAIFLTLRRPRFRWVPWSLPRWVTAVLREAARPVFLAYYPSGRGEEKRAVVEAERVLGIHRLAPPPEAPRTDV